MNLSINDIGSVDSAACAKLLIESLPNDFLCMLGERFIKECYFKQLSLAEHGKSFVFYEKNCMVAFLVSANSKGLLKQVVINNKFLFFQSVFQAFFRAPIGFSMTTISVLFYLLNPKCQITKSGFVELCYIVVNKSYRKKGMGVQLVNEMINYYSKVENIFGVYVKTLKDDIDGGAKDFYLKNEFLLEKECNGRAVLVRRFTK